MKEYKMNVLFEKNEIGTDLYDLVQYDYNSAKIKFTFDKEGTKEFKMLFPDKTYYIDEITDNEIILKEGLLNQVGEYEIEISIYNENSKLTEYATHKFEVRKSLIDGSEEAEIDDRLPILDRLITETNNLDVEVSKEENVTTIEVTKKDGSKEVVEVLDGAKGDKGDTGEKGETGTPGRDGADGKDGTDGADGADGFSPIAYVSKEDNKVRISITDKEGTTTAEVKDGIDETVDNLVNYYLKAETYTKDEVQELISAIKSMQIEVVENLPEVGESNKIYLVPKDGEENDVYNEYVWINNKYELIGNTEVDLTNFYTKEQTDNLLSNKVGKEDYAVTNGDGGIVKVGTYGIRINPTTKQLYAVNVSKKSDYEGVDNNNFISKGTLETRLEDKQDTLTAGENITIEDNVISAIGGGSSSLAVYYIENSTEDKALDITNSEPGIYYAKSGHKFYIKFTDIITGNVFTYNVGISYGKDFKFYLFKKYNSDLERLDTVFAYECIVTNSNDENKPTINAYRYYFNDNTLNYERILTTGQLLTDAGVQYVSGKKTFTTLPESSVVPSTNTQLVNKKYVDDAIASAITTTLGGEF